MKKRLLSLILAATLVLSLVVVPTNAADSVDVKLSTVGYDTTNAMTQFVVETDEITSNQPANIGDLVAVKITVENNTNDQIWFSGYHITLNYDSGVFETVTYPWALVLNGMTLASGTAGPIAKATEANGGIQWEPTTNTDVAGIADITSTSRDHVNIAAGGSAIVGYLLLKVKSDVESVSSAVTFAEGESANYINSAESKDAVSDSRIVNAAFNPVSIPVKGNPPVLDYITVTDANGNEVLTSKTQHQSYKVEINGTTDYTYYAHAYSKMGTDITSSVAWTIGGAASNNGTVITTGGANAGQIVVAKNAMPISAAVEAKLDNVTANAGNFVVGRADGSESAITDIKVSRTDTGSTLYVPTDGKTETATFTATAMNVYGDTIRNPSFSWKIADSNDKSLPTGVASFSKDGNDSILTVTDKAKSYTGTYTVYAYSNANPNIQSNKINVAIDYAPSEATELKIDANDDNTKFAVPEANQNGDSTTQTYDLPAVTVKDQYGNKMPDANVNWTLENAPSGVSIKDKELIVNSSAAANKFETSTAGDFKLEFTAVASCGNERQTVKLTLTRNRLTATTVKFQPNAILLDVPADGADPVTSKQGNLALVVKDQYGQDMKNPTVTWGITKADGSDATGVSIASGDVITVTNDAKADVTSTTPVNYTVTATVDGVSATTTIKIKRAASVATSITVVLKEGCADTLLIPGLDSTEATRQTEFVATVKDQYDAEIKNPSINWSIAPADVDGVTIDPTTGVVSVTTDAAKTIKDRTNFIVTAAVGTKTGTSTITVKRELPRITGFHLYTANKDGKKGAPLTNNSTAIIADGTNFLFVAWPHTQYGVDFTNDTYWKVEIFAQGSNTDILNSKEIKTTYEDTAGYSLLITSKIEDDTYRFVITQVSDKGEAVENPAKSEYSINLKRKADADLTISDGTTTGTSKTVTYGSGTFTLTAKATNHGTTGGTWGVSGIDTNILRVDHQADKLTLTPLKVGKTTFTMTYEDDTYYGSVTYTVTVSPKEVTVTPGSFKVSKTYDGTTNAGTGSGALNVEGILDAGVTVTPTIPAYTDANVGGQAKLTLDLALTGNTGNYVLKNTTVEVPCEITPKPVSIRELTFKSRPFNMNNSSAEIDTLTFDGVVSDDRLTYETGLIRVANNNVGTQSVDAFTVTLKNGNYCWTADGAGSTLTIPANTYNVQITKASYDGDKSDATSTKFGNSASFPLKSDLFPAGANVQSITVTASSGGIFDGTLSVTGTTLNYKIKADATPDQTGTITLAVESQNYETYNITVTVTVLDKIAQTIEAANVTMIYGDSAQVTVTNASALHGAVSYTVTNGNDVISVDNGKITALKSGTATVKISVAGDDDYAATEKNITVEVAKRPINLRIDDKTGYVGEKMPALTFRILNVLAQDQTDVSASLTPVVDNADAMKKTGRYEIHFAETVDSTSVTFPSEKYALGTVTNGTLTVTDRPIIDPTPMGSEITVIPAQDGTTKISTPKAVEGATVTITVTPDKDKELKSLEVIDENGSRLPLTDLGNGRFSFVMPAGKVSVSVVYGDVNDYVNPYLDVKTSDWYYEAVKYVTVNGLMNGTGAGRFEPNLATSRAMIWTILARMSGVNTTGGSVWYAAAQQWAIATGVSDGTNPNGTITREQLAAMLYRYAVSKGMVTAPVTADLSVYSDAASVSAYAVEAMQWAVGTGLINGMNGKLNPQGSATRAQVATMLMRFAQLSK